MIPNRQKITDTVGMTLEQVLAKAEHITETLGKPVIIKNGKKASLFTEG